MKINMEQQKHKVVILETLSDIPNILKGKYNVEENNGVIIKQGELSIVRLSCKIRFRI